MTYTATITKTQDAQMPTEAAKKAAAEQIAQETERQQLIDAEHKATVAGRPLLREFSSCGPCIVMGPVIRETAKFWIVQKHGHLAHYVARGHTAEQRVKKPEAGRYTRAHIEPCSCCTDHSRTQYPNGYMD